MKAVYFLGDRKLEIRDIPDPTPGPGEVILEIKASGMCGSDLKFYRVVGGAAALGLGGDGNPVIGGHEPCGVVVEVGPEVSERQARIGMRVMNHHYTGCGTCRHCATGWSQMCDDGPLVFGATGNGAHARYMKVPAHTLVPLPDELSFKTGAAISCGTGTAFGALDRLQLSGTDTIAIFGQGPVGLSMTQLASTMGARVIALDVDSDRLERAKAFGAAETVNADDGNVVEALYDLSGGHGVECACDCSSSPQARSQAIKSARKWGRVAFVGEGGDVNIDVSSDMLRKQLTLLGSWTFSKTGQADCARFVAERKVDVDALFTHSWSLDQAEEAYQLFDKQTTGKGVLYPID
jgi:L-iditol 2-dehydrogenase